MRKLATLAGTLSIAALFALTPTAFARNGADDPPGHNGGDDKGKAALVKITKGDDGPGHNAGDDRGAKARNGHDDPPGHNGGDDKGAR